ncbi:hypothetical protein K0U07_00355 [bacterium]|nr:hypothetical protein [bacterium]
MDAHSPIGRPVGRFWGGSSSSDSDSDTGTDTDSDTESGSNRSTPRGARPFFDFPLDPEFDAMRWEMERVTAFIDPATYVDCQPAKVESLKQRALQQLVPGYDYNEVPIHVRVVNLIKNSGRWVHSVFAYAESSGPFINFSHLTSTDGKGGWHFCSPSDVGRAITGTTINNATGVFTGWFEHEGRAKFSTFFPATVAPADLINFFSTATPLYRMGNRALFFYRQEEGASFYVEAYFRDNELVVQSAFPILHCLSYANDLSLTVNGAVMTDMVAMSLVDPRVMEKALVFETRDGVVVDLAKWNEIPGVPSGVYMYIENQDIEKYEF